MSRQGLLRATADKVRPQWMNRDVQLLMTARLCMSAARTLAGILVPIYLAQNGFGAAMLGALFAAVALASAILTAATGVFSGRFGRKLFIVSVPLLAAIEHLRPPGCALRWGCYEPSDSLPQRLT